MMDMEYRGYVRVPLDVESDDAEALLSALNRMHGDLGPVLSGEGADSLDVVLAADGDEAKAAGSMFGAVVEALLEIDLAYLYPRSIELEPVDAPVYV